MTLSDFRAGHHPIDDVEGAISTTPGYPAITQITFLACCAHYPGGSNRCLSTSSLFVLPSPVNGRVGIHDFTFGACSSFTHVAACQIACPPIADVCPEAPTQPVTRPSRSVATMLIDVYMDGSFPHWRSAPLRHTVNKRVALWQSFGDPKKSGHPDVNRAETDQLFTSSLHSMRSVSPTISAR